MTLIIGSSGSMGRRYQSILKHVDEDYETYDPLDNLGFPSIDYEKFDRFIIASPTPTHKSWARTLGIYGKPILCEKPLAMNMDDVDAILKATEKCKLTMMMQYAYFDRDAAYAAGDSWYHFYNHGKDGMVWDCFQIIALARGEISLREDTPLWDAGINGNKIDLNQMDTSYVWAVKNWLDGKYMSTSELRNMHRKVADIEVKWNSKQLA